jgi:hypothetical protein
LGAVAPEDDGSEASCNDGEKKRGGYGVFHGVVLSTKDAPPSVASGPNLRFGTHFITRHGAECGG